MGPLAFTRRGAGPPLVLLHPLGSSRHVWDPVIPALARDFEVLAIDLPGFGDSPPLASRLEAGPAGLAKAVSSLLDELGLDTPHVAGNSLGGWVALELAAVRPVASLTLFAPAGLWRRDSPLYCRVSLRATRWLAAKAAAPLSRLMRFRLGRILVLGQTHGRPARMSAEAARTAVRTMGTCAGFDAALRATTHIHYQPHRPITAPVTVAFGSRDFVLLRGQSRHLEELPSGTRLVTLHGCGHLPVADDPWAVIATIRATARSSRDVHEQARTSLPL